MRAISLQRVEEVTLRSTKDKIPESKRLCVLSGRFPPSGFKSIWNHRAYCDRHGYTYINASWPCAPGNVYMRKFIFIREYIEFFDYVFWIDDDAFFIDLDIDLMRFAPGDGDIVSFCRSPSNKSQFTYLSSGQFLLNGGKQGAEFVDAVLGQSLEAVEQWWRPELGMFTDGDQDAIVYLLHEDSRFRDRAAFFDHHAFNSRIDDLIASRSSVFLLHFVGSHQRKYKDHAGAMQFLQSGPSLLPQAVEDELLGSDRIHLMPTLYQRTVALLVRLFGANISQLAKLKNFLFMR